MYEPGKTNLKRDRDRDFIGERRKLNEKQSKKWKNNELISLIFYIES